MGASDDVLSVEELLFKNGIIERKDLTLRCFILFWHLTGRCPNTTTVEDIIRNIGRINESRIRKANCRVHRLGSSQE